MMKNLTHLECTILALAASGHANKEIAFRLNITEKTVKNHLTIIYDKLRVHNRTRAVVKAYLLGYLDFKEIP